MQVLVANVAASHLQMVFKLLDDRRPALPTGMLAGVQSDAAQGFILFQQPLCCVAKCFFIPGHGKHAVVAVANVLRSRRLIVGHHAKARGQGFQHDVAERFGHARKQEQITGRVMRRQGFATLRAAENRVGQFLLQGDTLRSVTDDDQFQIALWISAGEFFETTLEQTEVFFRRQASDMNDRDILLAQSPLRSQGIQAFGRVKQLTVDPPGQQRQTIEMPAFQFQTLADTRNQGQRRTIVEPAQIVGQQTRQQAKAVLVGVLLEIGVKTADHRDAQTARRAQCRQPERAFGGDVQHVRALASPASQQLVHRRLSPLQPRITRQRPAPAQQQPIVFTALWIVTLTRPHQFHPVPACAQTVAQAAKGIGHAVDFRWEGFADQGDVQSCRHGLSVC